jgi:hypothetical protein
MDTSTPVKNKPLQFYQPFNIIVLLSFLSPLIIAVGVTSLSFIFQNFKGIIYLGFLIGFCLIREFIYKINSPTPFEDKGDICTSIQYSSSKYGNPSFSAFVLSFTLTYLSVPMFLNGTANLWVFSGLASYLFIDIYIKIYQKCIEYMSDLFVNVLAGIFFGYLLVSLMNWGGSGKFLFFNEETSDREICTQPSTQTFRCRVYKNGELIGGV